MAGGGQGETFDRLFSLLGRRHDDPELLAFLKRLKLKAPRAATPSSSTHVVDEKRGFDMVFSQEVLLPGYYPPRKQDGQYLTYYASAFLTSRSETLPSAYPKTEKEAKKVALRIDAPKGASLNLYLMKKEGERECWISFWRDDGAFSDARIQLDELEEGDKRLKPAKSVALPARKPMPRKGKPKNAPLPPLLKELLALNEKGKTGDTDFEMLERIEVGGPKAWTGNAGAEHDFRAFGCSGDGGIVAFWRVDPEAPLEGQPVVFLGSEGAMGVVAKDLADFLYTLGGGVGPLEAVEHGEFSGKKNKAVLDLAARAEARRGRTPKAVFEDAAKAYPDFDEFVTALRER